MSPIIDLQRRMVEVGRIRAGASEDGRPRKLECWRLTSRDRERLERAATLWGGELRQWEGRPGEWELYTERDTLPIMLMPGHAPTTWLELWSQGGCQRRCDGVHELLSDGPCLCGDERECRPTTRLSVLLPDLPGIGCWTITSTGWHAAAELAGCAELIQRAAAQGILLPARLRLEQRTSMRGGQVRRYVVPVIDIDVSLRELLALGGSVASDHHEPLPSGYTPIPRSHSQPIALGQAIAQVEETEPREPRVPLPADDELLAEPDGESAADPPATVPSRPPGAPGNSLAASRATLPLTRAQVRKLDMLVGQLRESGRITTEQLWCAVAQGRAVDAQEMIELLAGRDAAGVLHWSPLRDSLTRKEASALLDRLERYAKEVAS